MIDPLSAPMSRRTLLALGSSVAGLARVPRAWSRMPSLELADDDGLRRLIEPSLAALGTAATTRRLGLSTAGRPIDLISIGEGERSALIVGAPHPNEPIGCLTVVALIRRLAADRRFREKSGYRWHFIPAIDVDGLQLNRGWFSGPRTLSNYFAHFFRPAFALQPEYGFPLVVPGYRFDASTAENLCWQRALEIARPTFQSSLHGSDSGGVYYLLSSNSGDLAKRLSRQPAAAGLALNRFGEPDTELANYAPGVFSFFEVAPMVEASIRKGNAPQQVWNAGRSSAEFAAEHYGTFSMTCEVPLWEDARQFSDRPSQFTRTDVLRMNLVQTTENSRLLDGARALLDREYGDPASQSLAAALNEAADFSAEQIGSLESRLRKRGADERVSLAELAQIEPGMLLMRTPAMVARLARRQGEDGLASAAEALVAARVKKFESDTPLRPLGIDRCIVVQMKSILTSMRIIG